MSDDADRQNLWDFAVWSWCMKSGGPEIKAECRFREHQENGARPGHEECEALLTAEEIGRFLGVVS